MADSDYIPRFCKVFISHCSSDSLLIPVSYYDELPRRLPKTALLQGTGGGFWKVEWMKKRNEVYFGQGWSKFVEDNSLTSGDFMTFVYNGDRIFEVSIYGADGCKEVRAVAEVEDVEEDSVLSLSSDDDTDTTVLRNTNNGKSRVGTAEESDDEEDSVSTDTEAVSRSKMAKTITRSRNKVTRVTPNVKKTLQKKKGGSSTRTKKEMFPPLLSITAKPMIKDPEAYLDDPTNIHFETAMKNRKFELLINAQTVKDYSLEFQDKVLYIDNHKDGNLEAKALKWGDQRVCIKGWKVICKRNELTEGDRVLCELFRQGRLVYAVKLHIVREKDL
ncbi:unnamed protein product [Thlaspi arvense]|uniref:TF-B3 domain-containing protein n=1 Tax=Thlaspi arvense TaxID=13288 RepID=A0AAU9T377_THLAR|nr:unnamed protein product [Thlaspi arvense]